MLSVRREEWKRSPVDSYTTANDFHTVEHPCPSPSLSLSISSIKTYGPVPYSALIDRERYTKLACIEVPKTSHSLKRNFLFSREEKIKKKGLGNVASFFRLPDDSSRYRLISFDRPSLFSPNEIARSNEKGNLGKTKFFNSKFIASHIICSYYTSYLFPKIYSRKTIPISERGDCLAY